MNRQRRVSGNWHLALGSFLAVVTACSQRVDPRDRVGASRVASAPSDGARPPSSQDAVSHHAVSPAATAAAGNPTTATPTADRDQLRHVDPRELFAAVRRLRTKGVALNVWATWCAPCREELAMLAKIDKTYQARGIRVLPLSVDEPENEGKIPEILRGFGFAPPYFVAKPPIADLKEALYDGWPGNIPVTFLLDGSAGRRYFFNAEVYEDELTPKLDALLAGSLTDGKSNFGVAAGAEL